MNHSKMIAAKRIAVAVAAVFATLSAPAMAADAKSLLDLMLKKGVITQAEYDDYLKSDAYENEQFKEKRTDSELSKASKFVQKHEKDGSVKESGFGYKSADGNNEINLTGRLHFDLRKIDNNFGTTADRDAGSESDRFSLRRARIGVTGVLNKDINYELITNLVGSNANLLDTGWANYAVSPEFQVRVGKFKQPYGMETLTSSNNISFMERSYQDQIAPGKQFGAMLHGEAKAFNYAASIYQTGFDRSSNQMGVGPEAAARLTTDIAKAFNFGADSVLHIGLAATAGKLEVTPLTSSQDGSDSITKGSFLEFRDENYGLSKVYRNRIYGTTPCSTNTTSAVCTYGGYSLPASETASVEKKLLGLELAGAYKATKFQYEYTEGDFTATSNKYSSNASYRTATSSGKAKVSYFEIIHNLTGEDWAPTYKSGVFGSVKPKSAFSIKDGTGLGAWQIGIRYSKYDASSFGAANKYQSDGTAGTDGTTAAYQVEGSPKGETWTYGLTWIMNPNARIMLNYSMTKFGSGFKPVDVGTTGSSPSTTGDKENVISLRSQFNF